MTRTEYLNQLKHYLKRLPHTDYEEAMDYFKEYFEEAGPENEAQVIKIWVILKKRLMKF